MTSLPSIGDPDAFVRTRESWHCLAEHVLARARYDATGRIGLQVTPGGFGTPPFDRDGVNETLHVVGTDLRIVRGDVTETH